MKKSFDFQFASRLTATLRRMVFIFRVGNGMFLQPILLTAGCKQYILHADPFRAPPMKIKVALTACGVLFFWSWTSCSAEMEAAGVVKSVKGRVIISRSGQSLEAAEGMKILMGDLIRTAETASVGLIFSDDSLVSMGPTSEMVVREYHFVPVEGRLSFVVRFIRGTIAYLSGQISKMSPQSVRLETPVGIIGVRGTQVLIKLEG